MIYIDLPQHVNDMVFSTSRQTPLVVGQAVKMWGISTTGYNLVKSRQGQVDIHLCVVQPTKGFSNPSKSGNKHGNWNSPHLRLEFDYVFCISAFNCFLTNLPVPPGLFSAKESFTPSALGPGTLPWASRHDNSRKRLSPKSARRNWMKPDELDCLSTPQLRGVSARHGRWALTYL